MESIEKKLKNAGYQFNPEKNGIQRQDQKGLVYRDLFSIIAQILTPIDLFHLIYNSVKFRWVDMDHKMSLLKKTGSLINMLNSRSDISDKFRMNTAKIAAMIGTFHIKWRDLMECDTYPDFDTAVSIKRTVCEKCNEKWEQDYTAWEDNQDLYTDDRHWINAPICPTYKQGEIARFPYLKNQNVCRDCFDFSDREIEITMINEEQEKSRNEALNVKSGKIVEGTKKGNDEYVNRIITEKFV